MIENQNPTIDDIIDELIAEDIIDEPSQVNKENGDITTNEPSYVISDKLNDFISNVKITISKTPETEPSGGVLLKVERVEGIDGDIDINNVDISTLSQDEKKKMIKIIDVFGDKSYTCFQDLLDNRGMTEQEYWLDIGNIDDYLKETIEFIKEAKVEIINRYTVINPDNVVENNYIALKNGNYTFKIKEILSGKEYTKSIDVTNINESLEYYYVKDGNGYICLNDKLGNMTDFQQAYIIYNEEKIDITDCIEDGIAIICHFIGNKLEEIGKIEDKFELVGTTQKIEIIKNGKSYYGVAKIIYND